MMGKFILRDKNTRPSNRERRKTRTDGSWQGVERTMTIWALLDPCGVLSMMSNAHSKAHTVIHTFVGPLFQKQVNGD